MLGMGQESDGAREAQEPYGTDRGRVRDHHEGQREQDGGEERRANLAVCDRSRHHRDDPRQRSDAATMPGSPTITLSPKLWIASDTAGRWRAGASLPCWTSAPMASPITLSQAA
jgi:hypothetical protein